MAIGSYCPKCGMKCDEDSKFCSFCGNPLDYIAPNTSNFSDRKKPYTPWGKPVVGEKSGAIAVLLSLLIPGLGTVYAGRGLRGLGLFLGVFVVYFLWVSWSFSWIGNGPGGFILGSIVALAYYIFVLYDGYASCKINNSLWYQYLGY